MKYPLEIKSTILDSKITITDADGQMVFRMSSSLILEGAHRLPVYKVKSDVGFASLPVFQFMSMNNDTVCAIMRNNLLSSYRSWYQILIGNNVTLKIQEGKAMGKVFGGLFDGTRLESVSARVWNPAFVVLRDNNIEIMTLNKRKSYIGTRYTIKKIDELNSEEERMALLSLFGLIQLERIYKNRFF